jgi:tRNA A-37 threonylcarbamoyl transferase component Bud32
MSNQASDDQARRQRLDEVIGSFLVALDAGRNPDPREWLSRHPDLCPELADFFADRALVDDLIEPMRAAPEPERRGTADDETLSLGDAAGFKDAAAAVAEANVTTMSGVPSPKSGAGPPTEGLRSSGSEVVGAHDDGSSDQLTKGTHVRYFGDYELERVLGEGGMGIVYKARQLSLNRRVALKMIKAARFASADDLRRFHNEAEAVARLDHPNIVPIFEVGQFQDQHYYSMKLVLGEGLDKRLKDFTGDPRRAARLMALVAGAIHHAHERGILHRDLKPANILVDADGQPHVTDYGLAKRVEGDSELTQTGAVLGTPAYMAPEQTSGRKGAITMATDVYGLGAILYALLTGRGPFGGTTVLETLDQVRQRAPEPPRSLNPRVPRDLEVICLKCLEKDPRRRYASADALAQDLSRWLQGLPIAARPTAAWEFVLMWARKRPEVAALALALTIVAMAGILGIVWQWRDAVANAESARRIAYVAHINLVEKELQDGHVDRAAEILDGERPRPGLSDLRGFEWSYLDHLCHAYLAQVHAVEGFAKCVAFSPDGRHIAWLDQGGVIRIWDAGPAHTNMLIRQSLPSGTRRTNRRRVAS